MRANKSLVALVSGLLIATAIQPVLAQGRFGNARGSGTYNNGYEDGYRNAYRDAYRAGYNDARANRRYDDTDYSYGYGYNPYVSNDPGRDQRWRQRYAQTYTYNDDSFYTECRQSVDPAGVIAGALIGGLLGNAVGRGGGRGGATVAGVIVGGALGATLTRNLDCEDRSYAYKTYYDGFNAGRPNARYEWRNPRSGHNGNFLVRDYYNDPDGFRCANYTQEIFINGRPQAASGRACQQPDGTWAIVS
jgi:surface antigen